MSIIIYDLMTKIIKRLDDILELLNELRVELKKKGRKLK